MVYKIEITFRNKKLEDNNIFQIQKMLGKRKEIKNFVIEKIGRA